MNMQENTQKSSAAQMSASRLVRGMGKY